jgi:hypothetical protein
MAGYHPAPMIHPLNPRAEGPPAVRAGVNRRAGIAVLLLLFAWHGWMTFTLVCPGLSWRCLVDERPILSGSHPLHLYHGYLGARSFFERGTLCCYDPGFQAGYPKTPAFDSGSRPAELFLAFAGGRYCPAAYKIGLAVCCLAVPVLLFLAARGFGFRLGASSCVVGLGLLIWWGAPCRAALEAGDLDLLTGSLLSMAFVSALISFDRRPRVRSWVGLVVVGALGWFIHQLLAILLIPVVLVYYLSVGVRHRLAWHAALAACLAAPLAFNSFWLPSWLSSWWMHLPVQFDADLPIHHTPHTFWEAALWGDRIDRSVGAFIFGLCAIGLAILNQTNRRAAARVLGLGAVGFLLLSLVGMAWRALGRLGTTQLYLPALLFATIPAVYALVYVLNWLTPRVRTAANNVAVAGCVVIALGIGTGKWSAGTGASLLQATPLTIGLSDSQRSAVEAIGKHTSQEARILWEETSAPSDSSCWTALLPILTDRAYIGGLGSRLCIEHAFPCLIDQSLAGRCLRETSDAELDGFCRRYNVGWVVCQSPEAIARFRDYAKARPSASLEGIGLLFDLRARSFVLKGQARVLQADSEKIALMDVLPEDGKVILSFHYQAGMQVSPGRVQIEREPDARDPVPFIRLRMPDPASRLTITWDGR